MTLYAPWRAIVFVCAVLACSSLALAAPLNDTCTGALAVSDGTISSTTSGASSDGGASCGNSAGSSDVWYLYTAACTGNVTFDTCGSSVDTVLSLYPGDALGPTTVFQDGFEGDLPADGLTNPAHWTVLLDSAAGTRVGVVNQASAGFAAAEGSNFLRLVHDGNDNARVYASLVGTGPAITDGAVTGTFSAYIPSTGKNALYANYWHASDNNPGGNSETWFDLATYSWWLQDVGGPAIPGIQPNQGVIAAYSNGAWTLLGLFDLDGWRQVTFVYDLDAPATTRCMVTVETGKRTDQSPAGTITFGTWLNKNNSVTGFTFASHAGDAIQYVDAVSFSKPGSCPGTAANELACNDNCGGSPCGGSSSCLTRPLSFGEKVLVRVAGANGAAGDFILHIACSPTGVPANDTCTSATEIGTGTLNGTTLGANSDGFSDCGGAGSPDVWYQFTAAATGTLKVDTCGSTFDTVVSLHDVSSTLFTDAFEGLTPGATNPDNGIAPGYWNTIENQDLDGPGNSSKYDVEVTNAASPGAAQGSQYLRFHKPIGEYTIAVANFASVPQGGQIQADLTLYVDSAGGTQTGGDGTHVQLDFTSSPNGGFGPSRTFLGFAFPGGDLAAIVDNTGWQPGQLAVVAYNGNWINVKSGGANMFIPADQWLTVHLDYTVGTSYTVTVNGVTSDPVGQLSSHAGTVTGLEMRSNVGNRESLFYVDALSVNRMDAGCPGSLICNDECSGGACGGPASCLSAPLQAGESRLIRVAGTTSAAKGAFTLNVAFEPPVIPPVPANDACATAIVLTDGTTHGTTLGATRDGTASCGDSTASPDVWYKYTATGNGTLFLNTCTTGFDSVLSVVSGCGGAELAAACSDDCGGSPCGKTGSCLSVPVTSGTTYLVRVAGFRGANGDFDLAAMFVPSITNDTCETAQTVSLGTTSGTTILAAVDGDSSCGSSASSPDVFYTFTPDATGNYTLSVCPKTTFTPVLSVHSACPASLGNELACSASASGAFLVVSLTASTSCIIRVSGANGSSGNFDLNIAAGGGMPALPLAESFEAATVGSAAGWETGYPTISSSACGASPVAVVDTEASPNGGGSKSLHWLEPGGGPRSSLIRRWQPLPSSTTAKLHVACDLKVVQHTTRGLGFVVSGWDASNTISLNVYAVRFDSDTSDGLSIGWNYLDNGSWNNFIPVSDPSQVIGHWFHYDALIDVGARTVDLTIARLDNQLSGHIVGSFQTDPGVNPLDADLANYQGIGIFQSNPAATSELLMDNVVAELADSCPRPFADTDRDGDVDQVDFGIFQTCFTGSAGGVTPECQCFDRNQSNAIDLADLNKFIACFSGPTVPANPACAN
ncbi:MAG TPA: hypothetical protein PKY77_23140 [Phycisphaerae bacterium]|nr:hypothetical protein [Phycisphaerae bacterium]HRY71306.1 hypothetical protein [Phycisphaerae bacterium]HSA29694.1 hypothetical protein [Phycisphaerae bacterium]